MNFALNYAIIMYLEEDSFMPQIRPTTDLRNTTEISELCHAKREPLLTTRNGYVDIGEAEKDYAADGVLIDASEALPAWRKKHFG